MLTSSTQKLFETACEVLPGGVSASARRNASLNHPFYVSRGDGPLVYDLDGNPYVDMCCSHGASFLGHNHPSIKMAVQRALELGIVCSAETEYQVKLALQLRTLVPCAEMSRFSSSGTETMMHGLRLARAATGRQKFIKFEGHFHGYSDGLNFSSAPPLEKAGPYDAPIPFPQSAGIPNTARADVIVVPFNDFTALESVFDAHGSECAALIMEPINYDSGCILPEVGFIERCRELCDTYRTILFFDEVLTAFRTAPGCAQEALGVVPDLAVLGKAFGGGMPISALVGKRWVMNHLRPQGESEMSGTYLSHLTATLAASAALDQYATPGFYDTMSVRCERFYNGFQNLIDRSGLAVRLQHCGARFGVYFGLEPDKPVVQYRAAARHNLGQLLTFARGCVKRGTYLHISAHHGFSFVHTDAELDRALEAIEGALNDVKEEA